jgi:23S rRNA (uracil1939-C5)-methyltransferase
MSNPPQNIRVRAVDLADEGHGIAFFESSEGLLEVRVADLLPGESALVQIDHKSPHKNQAHRRAWGHIIKRIGPLSEKRAKPPCPAFGQCGGCAWQHLAIDAQLEHKRLRVQRALERALHRSVEVPAVHAAPAISGYRNKGKYVFGKGHLLGAYRPRSHEVVSTLGCQVVEPIIDEVATALQSHCVQLQMPALRYAILRSNAKQEVLVTLVCHSHTSADAMQKLADALRTHASVIGVVRCDNDLQSGGLLTNALTPLCGQAELDEEIASIPFKLGTGAFWQVHRQQAELAYRALVSAVPLVEDKLVLELFSGVGAIALMLAKAGHQVRAIESSAEATACAQAACKAMGLEKNAEFVCGDARALKPGDFANVHTVIVDPPRKGLTRAGCEQLLQAKPRRIAYLSCGPDSLADDIAMLESGGYRLEQVRLFDFMPGTAQIETLVVLER